MFESVVVAERDTALLQKFDNFKDPDLAETYFDVT